MMQDRHVIAIIAGILRSAAPSGELQPGALVSDARKILASASKGSKELSVGEQSPMQYTARAPGGSRMVEITEFLNEAQLYDPAKAFYARAEEGDPIRFDRRFSLATFPGPFIPEDATHVVIVP